MLACTQVQCRVTNKYAASSLCCTQSYHCTLNYCTEKGGMYKISYGSPTGRSRYKIRKSVNTRLTASDSKTNIHLLILRLLSHSQSLNVLPQKALLSFYLNPGWLPNSRKVGSCKDVLGRVLKINSYFSLFILKLSYGYLGEYVALSDPGTMQFVPILGQSPHNWSTMLHWNVVSKNFHAQNICHNVLKIVKITLQCIVVLQSRGEGHVK